MQDALLRTVLKGGSLLPVDTVRWDWTDLHNAYRNADEFLLLCAIIDKDAASPEVWESLRELQRVSAKVRQGVMKLLVWSNVPLAKSLGDKYRNSIAEHYAAMVEAGEGLVSAGVPQHAWLQLYRSLCKV